MVTDDVTYPGTVRRMTLRKVTTVLKLLISRHLCVYRLSVLNSASTTARQPPNTAHVDIQSYKWEVYTSKEIIITNANTFSVHWWQTQHNSTKSWRRKGSEFPDLQNSWKWLSNCRHSGWRTVQDWSTAMTCHSHSSERCYTRKTVVSDAIVSSELSWDTAVGTRQPAKVMGNRCYTQQNISRRCEEFLLYVYNCI